MVGDRTARRARRRSGEAVDVSTHGPLERTAAAPGEKADVLMRMRVPKETDPGERRVALVPSRVRS